MRGAHSATLFQNLPTGNGVPADGSITPAKLDREYVEAEDFEAAAAYPLTAKRRGEVLAAYAQNGQNVPEPNVDLRDCQIKAVVSIAGGQQRRMLFACALDEETDTLSWSALTTNDLIPVGVVMPALRAGYDGASTNDISGNGRHLVQPNSPGSPENGQFGTYNGQPAFYHARADNNGAAQYFRLPVIFEQAQNYTLVIGFAGTIAPAQMTEDQIVLGCGGAATGEGFTVRLRDNVLVLRNDAGDEVRLGPQLQGGLPHIGIFCFDAAANKVRVYADSKTQIGEYAYTVRPVRGDITLGCAPIFTGGYLAFTGYVSRLYFYEDTLNQAQVEVAYDELHQKMTG